MLMNKNIFLKDNEESLNLCGQLDENLHLMENAFKVAIIARGNKLTIKGEVRNIQKAEKVVEEILEVYRSGHILTRQEIKYIIDQIKMGMKDKVSTVFSEVIYTTLKGENIKAKTLQQQKYLRAIKQYDMVVAIGPAGTGKTYLAVASALAALKAKEISRIVLTRPLVEAGEKLGYLPGDLQEKVNPYLYPLYDAFFLMLGYERFQRLREEEIVEVVPLAYMRGRTLNDAFIILDEAQNTTADQMKMFLTRLGFESRMVITGDITQIDLEKKDFSGLVQMQYVLKKIKEIEFISFSSKDVIRHKLVSRIIEAYSFWEKKNNFHKFSDKRGQQAKK
ncbi:PhoH family protein [bacterium]|nr:PhoH family protein [bacterium]